MNRTGILRSLGAALLALLLASTAFGQVAAPRLFDVGATAGNADNPAAIPWYENSEAAVIVSPDVTVESTPQGGATTELATGDAHAVLLRAVGDTFAVSARSLTTSFETTPAVQAGGGPPSFEVSEIQIAAAGKMGKSLALGIAVISGEVTLRNQEFSRPVVGGTLRIGDTFYIGGDYGAETVTDTTNSAEGDRTVTRFGAGFRERSKGGGWHLEVYREAGSLLEVRDAAQTLSLAEEVEATGVTVEFLWGSFLFGYEKLSTTTQEIIPPNPLDTLEEDEQSIILGWAPEQGFAISITNLTSEEMDSAGNLTKVSTTAIGLGYMF